MFEFVERTLYRDDALRIVERTYNPKCDLCTMCEQRFHTGLVTVMTLYRGTEAVANICRRCRSNIERTGDDGAGNST
jgi:hypothetical protein